MVDQLFVVCKSLVETLSAGMLASSNI